MIDALKERLTLAVEIAKAKHNSGAPVEDKARERQVVFRAIREGVRIGVDPEVTLKVFTAQIEASKVVQRQLMNRWQSRGKFSEPVDLGRVRVRLDELTPVILNGLKTRRYPPQWALRFDFKDPALNAGWSIAIRPLSLTKLDRGWSSRVGASVNLGRNRPGPR